MPHQPAHSRRIEWPDASSELAQTLHYGEGSRGGRSV
jgi:hypothetical protein